MNTHLNSKSSTGPDLSIRRRGLATPYSAMVGGEGFDGASGDAQHSPAALQAAWDKLYRARSILEAEQAHLRDDRIAIQGAVEDLERRLQAVIAREERVRQMELQATLDREEAEDARRSESSIIKITKAPFEIARTVFSSRK